MAAFRFLRPFMEPLYYANTPVNVIRGFFDVLSAM